MYIFKGPFPVRNWCHFSNSLLFKNPIDSPHNEAVIYDLVMALPAAGVTLKWLYASPVGMSMKSQ